MKARKISMFIILGTCPGITSLLALRILPLWSDTRINCSVDGSIRLVSGHTVPTNKWFSLPEDAGQLEFLQIYEGENPRNYLFQDGISRDLAMITTPEGSRPLELIRAGGSIGRTGYWLEPRTPEAGR